MARSNNDGEISEDEMDNANLKTIDERLNSKCIWNPWYDKATPKTQISPRFALSIPDNG